MKEIIILAHKIKNNIRVINEIKIPNKIKIITPPYHFGNPFLIEGKHPFYLIELKHPLFKLLFHQNY